MKGIIATNNLGYIGLNNSLPWRCSEDLKLFKSMTQDDVRMLVGYNTYLTLPEVVKKRGVTVDTRECMLHPMFPILNDKGEFDSSIPYICIGGKKTYEKYCHMFTELHISHINDNTIGDTMFPDLKNLNPDCKIFNYYFETNKKTN